MLLLAIESQRMTPPLDDGGYQGCHPCSFDQMSIRWQPCSYIIPPRG